MPALRLKRRYNLDAPKGVNGRNSDNSKILSYLGWEPSTRLRDGLAKTYEWIESQMLVACTHNPNARCENQRHLS